MDALFDLCSSLVDVFQSLLQVVVNLVRVLLPWLPLLAWVGFWSFAVNWGKAFPILRRGGLVGVLLLLFVAVLVWGAALPPVDGQHMMFGLTLSNYAGKFVYVTMLACIALLCGSAQLSGAFGRFCEFSDEANDENGHGHDASDSHPADGHVGDSHAHTH